MKLYTFSVISIFLIPAFFMVVSVDEYGIIHCSVIGDPSNIHKQRIFSLIFAKNPVK